LKKDSLLINGDCNKNDNDESEGDESEDESEGNKAEEEAISIPSSISASVCQK